MIQGRNTGGIFLKTVAAALVLVLTVVLFSGCEKKSAQSYIEEGNALLSRYKYDEAIKKYEKALQLDENSLDACLGMADAFLGNNEYELAANMYVTMGDRNKAASIYESHGQTEKAVGLYYEDFKETANQDSYNKYLGYTDYELSFTDPAVETLVREYLGKPEGTITRNELNDITGVRIYGNDCLFSTPLTESSAKTAIYDNYSGNKRAGVGDIESLADFANFANLEYLLVYYNSIEQVDESLNAHDRLTCLYLSYNYIDDLTSVAKLTNIKKLGLTGNNINDVTPLSQMTGLELLYLQKNRISDIAPLAELTGLTTLLLSQNSITDVSPLASLTELTELYLDNNYYLKDISSLAGLVNLEKLVLGRTKVTNYSALADLQKLDRDYLDLRTA